MGCNCGGKKKPKRPVVAAAQPVTPKQGPATWDGKPSGGD